MKISKTALSLGVVSVFSWIAYAVSKVKKRYTAKQDTARDLDEDIDLVFECFDEMIEDIKQMHKRQDEQDKRLESIEKIVNNTDICGD